MKFIVLKSIAFCTVLSFLLFSLPLFLQAQELYQVIGTKDLPEVQAAINALSAKGKDHFMRELNFVDPKTGKSPMMLALAKEKKDIAIFS